MTVKNTFFLFLISSSLITCGPGASVTPSAQSSSTIESSVEHDKKDTVGLPYEAAGSPEDKIEPNLPFAMDGGGPKHLYRTDLAGPSSAPQEVVRFHTGKRIAASPVIGPDGTIYIGSVDGTFNALSRNGNLRWTYICGEPIFSTAAVSKTGRVFVGCDDDTLIAFATDGMLRFTVNAKQDVDSSPVIDEDGTVYFGADQLYAINNEGIVKFKLWLGGHISASPSIRPDGVIAVGSHDRRFYLVEPDASVLASFETKGRIFAPAAALSDNDVVFGSEDGFIYRLAPKGAMRWKLNLKGAVKSGIAVNQAEDTLYATVMTGSVFAVDAKNGKVKWQTDLAGPIKAAPMLDSQGLLFVGSRDHSLYALNSDNGDIVWRISLESEIDVTPAIASGQRLVAAADDGVVRILEVLQ